MAINDDMRHARDVTVVAAHDISDNQFVRAVLEYATVTLLTPEDYLFCGE